MYLVKRGKIMQNDDPLSDLYIKIFHHWKRTEFEEKEGGIFEWSVSNPMDKSEAFQLANKLNPAFTAVTHSRGKFFVCFNVEKYAKYGEKYGGNWRDLIVAGANTPHAQDIHPTKPISQNEDQTQSTRKVRFKDALADESAMNIRKYDEKFATKIKREITANELATYLSRSVNLSQPEKLSESNRRAAVRFLKSENAPPEIRKPRGVSHGDHFKRMINISYREDGDYKVLVTFPDYEPESKPAEGKRGDKSNLTNLILTHSQIMSMINTQLRLEKTTPSSKKKPRPGS